MLLMIIIDQFMSTQYQLVPLKRVYQETPVLEHLKKNVKSSILRLMNRQIQQVQTSAKSTRQPIWMYIDPQSWIMTLWSFLFMALFYLIELQITLSVAFGPSFFENQLKISSDIRTFYIFALSFLVMDVIISFFVGYYAFGKGRVVDDPTKVAFYYLKHQFPIDLVVILLYIIPLIHQSFGINFLQLLTAGLLWVKKFKYQTNIQTFLQYSAALRAGFMLFILFVDALMFGHFGACIFIWIDVQFYNAQYYGTNTLYYWLSNNQDYNNSLINGPWYFQYVYGQFFSTGTLSTLAPGPFPKNPLEAGYAIIVMVVFMIYASYLGDVLIQIVYTYAQRRMAHQQNIRAFDNFMRLKEVSQQIRLRVYNFFQLKWEHQFKTESTQQEEMISKLPKYLKEQLLLEIGFTNHIYFLQELPNEQLLKKMVSLKIQRTTADADTLIFASHQPKVKRQPRSLYYIKEGMAKFFLKDQNLKDPVLSLSNVQRVLGVYEFITGQDYSISCKSIDLCLLQTLTWIDFKQILLEMKLQQQFQVLRHKVLIERQLSLIHKTCIVCLQNHVESQCTCLYFTKTIQKGYVSESGVNKRRIKKRRNLQSQKVVNCNKTIQGDIFSFSQQMNLGSFLMELIRLELKEDLDIQQMWAYNKYYPEFNIKTLLK